ncbi:hypothetical protein MNV49_002344 [Pseudohyphozyma bogoriensis]|nr:hypothetical protein MNV49_002344 [Pseudohyphozyma bogoriensis]
MSRAPSLPPSVRPPPPVIKPSGIHESFDGERKVAASRRPDGSLRKEIKIRPGFTPEEDVVRYRSIRSQEQAAREAVKGRVPGLVPGSGQAAVQAVVAGMSKAQKKNLKRKEKRKEDADKSGEEEGEGEEDVPEDWDADEGEDKGKGGKAVEAVAPPPPPPPPVEDSKRVKALKKKIRQAEQLKERDGMGLYLPPAERVKIASIPDLEAELEKLVLKEKEDDGASPSADAPKA